MRETDLQINILIAVLVSISDKYLSLKQQVQIHLLIINNKDWTQLLRDKRTLYERYCSIRHPLCDLRTNETQWTVLKAYIAGKSEETWFEHNSRSK